MKNIGIYIHVPFCATKCPYCDFYSRPPLKGSDMLKRYTESIVKYLSVYSDNYGERPVDTVYFGGGTPSLLGADNLCEILSACKKFFKVTEDAEITVEANPCSVNFEFFRTIKEGGFNRLSMGLQSANDDELEFLGRKHSSEEAAEAVKSAQKAGFDNISLDLMMGLPNQTEDKLRHSIEFCASLGVQHISSYILKIEENTVFGRKGIESLDDDETGDLYLFMVNELAKHGYNQYEISNFCKAGFMAGHNTKYWHCEEYIGIGPSAHSFIDGRRFYYDRNLDKFINGTEPVQDGEGGEPEEKIMLALRLTEGITPESFGENVFNRLKARGGKLPENLINISDEKICLTPEGFLVSNSVILFLLDN
ncbi:MAG: radical SAM family heme chaperone HemW [Clostridia bacterium]|nr:radical SAM family heme chaperone HemW [Clostridia bacterium]